MIVATVRALKYHDGVPLGDLGSTNVNAVRKGFADLACHIENVAAFGVPAVVAINRFTSDTDGDIDADGTITGLI